MSLCMIRKSHVGSSVLVPAVSVDTPARIGILFVCFSCVRSTRHVIEVIAGALDVQNKTRPIHLMNYMSNSGCGIGVVLGCCLFVFASVPYGHFIVLSLYLNLTCRILG